MTNGLRRLAVKLLGRFKCIYGSHTWSDWNYEAADQCQQRRVCDHCSKTESRSVHSFDTGAYRAPTSCNYVTTCQRCRLEERITRHQWGSFNYESSRSCFRRRECGRCRETERDPSPEHRWEEWNYEAPDSCVRRRICTRCSEIERDLSRSIFGGIGTTKQAIAAFVGGAVDDVARRSRTPTQIICGAVGHIRMTAYTHASRWKSVLVMAREVTSNSAMSGDCGREVH